MASPELDSQFQQVCLENVWMLGLSGLGSWIVLVLHTRNLTWQWKNNHLKMYLL